MARTKRKENIPQATANPPSRTSGRITLRLAPTKSKKSAIETLDESDLIASKADSEEDEGSDDEDGDGEEEEGSNDDDDESTQNEVEMQNADKSEEQEEEEPVPTSKGRKRKRSSPEVEGECYISTTLTDVDCFCGLDLVDEPSDITYLVSSQIRHQGALIESPTRFLSPIYLWCLSLCTGCLNIHVFAMMIPFGAIKYRRPCRGIMG